MYFTIPVTFYKQINIFVSTLKALKCENVKQFYYEFPRKCFMFKERVLFFINPCGIKQKRKDVIKKSRCQLLLL